jgi:flavin reductase (DIM6/NTAB) family NADH-FMN oxidoreductase RutF
MSSSAPNPETEAIAQSLGRVPSGLFILVAGDGADRRTGLLASWLQQASFEPPQVTVAVNKSRYLNDWLKLDSPVSINQVPRNDPGLLKHFGRGFEPDVDAFAEIGFQAGSNGLPLLNDAMCSMEGVVAGSVEAGDHIIYLITVTNAHGSSQLSTVEPFIHLRKNGLGY